ncbi:MULTISPECIES: outer membrane lipoprotein-sorting protein [Thiomicrorhabdus]|uniref:Outer membrane lipoprotein-sorting protein n=1 Tax=Thiomicrorhabdus heinhorstiae TaxID=2748010 RepID=A0ABS0BXE0_9GAMM|nr:MULTISPECIES: outer membrane lipoprotein-sorting protein [Thiomicrorhabdus]MBF6057758.1 outer membrane lipoprotein-sorting protein [Thiomicrorhabdus heinhorstiae]
MLRLPRMIFSTLIVALLATPLYAHAAESSTKPVENKTEQPTAKTLIQQALELWRGKSSYSEISMEIHRPEWQRKMSMIGWTEGLDRSLIRFTYPPKDAGNATLKLDEEMWLFTPKLQRITKLPTSMMSQSWMGSDFSYNDLSKTDQILKYYDASIDKTENDENGNTLYHLTLIPHQNAPVVWGKETLIIRADGLLLNETFYDQTGKAVKSMQTLQIMQVSGRPYPKVMRMTRSDKPDQWTQVVTDAVWFDLQLPSYLFTQSNLKTPRPWSAPKP